MCDCYIAHACCAARAQTQDVHYDVVGHPRANFMFTVVLPFHTSNNGTGPQV